ncbi:two-component system response regulator OmpR [Fulvimonas soli]|jgi:two-component system phosphate regulon response regulator OmpR|uniref:Winged helix family two component transcriptional regulator n=1 Tax=Fulvimonas soli TaxID=155197 RepID=A0A316II89_9GAMM|nr:two-component system response regulator OmpR [Fulvimonas soli]PWK92889.1 winged helix family two component transcriptional regulator [Fulvimonas soli]TNY26610.1 two-component system response regulator OmpR [Fulvimonas soli]
MESPRILVVDDDLRLRDLLERYLARQGLHARGVASAAAMRKALAEHHVDLIVLDLMLPDGDGLELCRALRAEGVETPVIMLTAKGDEVDRIVGLEIGADDYLPKPCNPRELVARIRAVLRRRPRQPVGAPQAEQAPVRFGRFTFDPATRQLLDGDAPVKLTSGEFAVLAVLVAHPFQTLSREKLIALARGREHEAFDRSIDVMVSRLRRCIEDDPRQPRWLQTVWGEGYVFVPEGDGP